MEPFRIWRDEVVKPILEQIDQEKKKCLEYSEGNLKALIMYENLIKELFINVFEESRIIREQKDKII